MLLKKYKMDIWIGTDLLVEYYILHMIEQNLSITDYIQLIKTELFSAEMLPISLPPVY